MCMLCNHIDLRTYIIYIEYIVKLKELLILHINRANDKTFRVEVGDKVMHARP